MKSISTLSTILAVFLNFFVGSLTIAAAQTPSPSVTAKLSGPATVGKNGLMISVINSNGQPAETAKVTLSVAMSAMDMGTSHPSVTEQGKGVYVADLDFSMSGGWSVTVKVEIPGQQAITKTFTFEPKQGMKGGMSMEMGSMRGSLGPWSMSREGSGTSWLPDSSPMFMLMLPKNGQYDMSVMGYFTLNYTSSGGLRGGQRFYSNSMPMLMASRETGGGTLGMHLMLSLDPIFNGEYGYPDLFQTGETAYGQKLQDEQHPHNLLSELTGSYSHPIGQGVRAFVYGGPVGEPALGGPAFPHRPSGFEIPEAPISHHWFDSTHISFGVATLGVNTDKWQLEGSVFNGHEPGENRYIPGPFALNSASTRLTYNPNKNLSLNTSYGYLDSPESSSPGVDQHRRTDAAIWSLPLAGGDNLSVSALHGARMSQGATSDAYLLEATYLTGTTSYFVRWERVDEDELVGVPPGSYTVNKILFGGVRNFTKQAGLEVGIGAYAGLYSYPSALDQFYGHGPVTLGAFLRIRPARMKM